MTGNVIRETLVFLNGGTVANAREVRYTDNRLKILRRSLLRVGLCCAASGSGLFGSSMVPGSEAYRAANASFPALTWWRKGARAGVAEAEAFANRSPVA
jgi:hypothetical protein